MATFKAEIYKHQQKADGTWNVKIRVIHKTRKKYIATPYYVEKSDLTKSYELKNRYYIDELDKLVRHYRRVTEELGMRIEDMDVNQVVDYIKTGGVRSVARWDLDFIEYGQQQVDKMIKSGRQSTANSYNSALKSMVRYVGREKISINEITTKFVDGWLKWVGEEAAKVSRCSSQKSKGVGAMYVYFGAMRALHNKAKREFNDEDLDIVRVKYTPFKNPPRLAVAEKRAISLEELRRLATAEVKEGKVIEFARDVFMLSFGLIGMNSKDLYNCTKYDNGRLDYQRAKTMAKRADSAQMSVFVEPELKGLMEKYRDTTGERVFRFHKMYKSHRVMLNTLGIGLRKIGQRLNIDGLQFYGARHTWATLAANEAGVDRYAVHRALNHVDQSMKVTEMYIKKDWKDIDQANRKVLDYVALEWNKSEGNDR